jgi:hypothetical protein
MEKDKLGDSLRRFYKVFGMENEGPPDNLNVTNLFPSVNFIADIDLIEKLCNNHETVEQHNECKELIEKIAASLGDAKFMNEINDSIISCTDFEKDHLTNGIFWHYLASMIDPKMEKKLGFEIPLPVELPKMKQELLKVHGSLIFRLYIVLVYMKEGPLIKMIKQTAINKKPISQLADKLLRCDYVRHLRNALSHSTFESTTFGIYFNDMDKFETVASPEFLNSLTTWIMLLNFQCSTVIDSKTKISEV